MMSIAAALRRVLLGLVLLLLPTTAGRGEEPETTKQLASADGRYRLSVPVDWVLEPADDDEAALCLAGTVPGVEGAVRLALHDVVDVLLSGRANALFKLPGKKAEYDTEDVVYRGEPLDHLVVRCMRDGKPHLRVFAYLRRKGHGIRLHLSAPADAAAVVYPAFLEIAASVEADVEAWPPPLPAAYKSKTVRGIRMAWAPEVTGREVQLAERYVAKVVKEFERFHGKIERPADEPLTIVLHASLAAVKSLCPETAELRDVACADLLRRRVHTVPGKESYWKAWAPSVRRALTRILLHERYRILLPNWVRIGELEWVFYRERAETRKPVFPHARGRKLEEGRIQTLEKLESFAETDWGAHAEQAHLYVLLFHRGPAKYKSAYKRFLALMADTGDWEAAASKHLFPLGLQKMRADAKEFLAKKVESVFD